MVGGTRTTTSVYDLRGRPSTETDPASVVTTHTTDAAGNETRTVAGVVTTDRAFDGLGNVTTETTAPGTGDESITTRTFDGQGHELTTTVNGATTTRVFDKAGRLVSETVDGETTTHTYDRLGRETSTSDPATGTSTTVFDRLGRATRTTDANGLITDTVYDADGNAVSVTHPYTAGQTPAKDTTVLDALNRPTATIVNDVVTPSAPDEDVTTRTWYDAAGRTLTVQDPALITTRTIVNVRGLASQTIANCTDTGTVPVLDPPSCRGDQPQYHTATMNLVTNSTYDGSGAQLSSVSVRVSAPNIVTYVAFDAAGRTKATKDPRGTVTRTLYDSSGRVSTTIENCVNGSPPADWSDCTGTGTHDAATNLVTAFGYDARGNKVSETAANGRVTTSVFDDADQLVKTIDNDVASPAAPDQDVTTEYAFDDAGRQIAAKDPAGRVTVNVYDANGRLQKTITACKNSTPPASWWLCTGTATADWQTNLTTSYTYDAAGRKLSETAPDPSSTGVGAVTTRYAYDGAGRLCRVLEAATTDLQGLADPCATAVSGTTISNVSTRYLYDDNGNLTTMIDANGHQTSYGFDSSGRMTSLTDPDGKTLQWSYDASGNRVSQTNRTTANTQIVWTYDELNRMISRTADGVTVSYTYDGNGNRLTAGDGTRTITTVYDPLNRPTGVTTSDDTGAATSYTYSFSAPTWTDPSGAYAATLDKFGRQTSVTDPIHPGAPFTTTYGADGHPSAMTAPNGNGTAFTSDQAGRPLLRTTTGTGGVSRASYVWTRNAAGVVRSETSTITGDTSNGTATFGYDPLSRLTTFTAPPGVTNQTTSWQAVPNRASLQFGTGTPVTTTYDPANRPTVDSGGGSYTSDFDGRLLTMPGHVLTYDSLGRLTADTTGGATSAYTYDPLDRLRTVTRSGAVQRFRYVGATTAMAQVLDGAGSVIRSFGTDWTGTHFLDWTGSGQNQRVYGTNGHGDVTWTADGTGAVTASIRYDPWGVKQISTGSLPDFRFQGSWSDTATGLSWAVNRWYAPSLGRFRDRGLTTWVN